MNLSVRLKLVYDPDRKCLKCYKHQGFIFYCEDCGGTFCNDCIVSEKTDCTYCSNCSHISVGSKCEKCGNVNHLSATKKIRKCPMCSSTKLKDVKKKIGGLTNEFIDTVNRIYNGLNHIKGFADNYSDIVNLAKQLRRERFGLYPNIETNLLHIQNQFFEITQRATELLDKVYQQIHQDSQLLSFNQNLTINKLPRIDKTLKMINTHVISYSNIINDFLEKPRLELSEIGEKLTELKDYSLQFDEASDKFEPELLELKIAVFPNMKITFPKDRKRTGILYVTNKQLYFLPYFKFIFRFRGKVKAIPISMIRDVETKSSKIFGSQLLINIPDKNQIKIKCSDAVVDRLNFTFGILFNENEGYVITDPYMMEEYRSSLNYSLLQEKVERRIKDLKQIPFTKTIPLQQFRQNDDPRRFLVQESEDVKNLKIELRAAKDTLRELIKAFNDRSITPEVYFSRREKTKHRILTLEDELKDAQRSSMGLSRLRDFVNHYTGTYTDGQPRR